ncbi:MAG TPA: glycosyltransferase [Phycisphaerales bacterium]|nr:glycosyltransferase [Phycisphaerales bacterium]
MKILYVTKALIAPPYAGCMQRTVHIARQLKPCGQVTMLAINRRFDSDSVNVCRQEFSRFDQILLRSYTDFPKRRGELLRKFHMHWPTLCGIRADRQGQALFETLAAQHDVIWFHTLGAAQPFSLPRTTPMVMDLDDLNHCKYEQSARIQTTLRFRLSAHVQSYKWKRLEREALKRYAAVVVCSEQDKQLLGGDDKIFVVPNGFTLPAEKPTCGPPDPLRLGFIGTLGYHANHHGLIWFRDQVWPLILKQRPNASLRIIGALPPEKNRVKAEGFEYLGYIADPGPEMQTWSAMVVPIVYGGGTRIKILDAFSKRCPVVSTRIGAYGIDATDNIHFLLADTAEQFAERCLQLMDNPSWGKTLADEAWTLLTQKYQWETIGVEIRNVVSEVLKPICQP